MIHYQLPDTGGGGLFDEDGGTTGPTINPPGPVQGLSPDQLVALLTGRPGLQPQNLNWISNLPFVGGGLGNLLAPLAQSSTAWLSPGEQLLRELTFGSQGFGAPSGGGTDPAYLQLQRDQFMYAQERDALDREVNTEQNNISRYAAESQRQLGLGNLEVSQRAQAEVERSSRRLEELNYRRLQLDAAMQPAQLGLQAALGTGNLNLERAKLLQEMQATPGNVFQSFYTARGQPSPGLAASPMGAAGIPGQGQPFFGLMDQLPPWQSFVPDVSGLSAPLPEYQPPPFTGAPGGLNPLMAANPALRQEDIPAALQWIQAFSGAPSAQRGGVIGVNGPVVGINMLTGLPEFTAGEPGPRGEARPEIIDIKPMRGTRGRTRAKGTKSMQGGGTVNVNTAETLRQEGNTLRDRLFRQIASEMGEDVSGYHRWGGPMTSREDELRWAPIIAKVNRALSSTRNWAAPEQEAFLGRAGVSRQQFTDWGNRIRALQGPGLPGSTGQTNALLAGQTGGATLPSGIPGGLPSPIADLYGQGFPQWPWLTSMGLGQGIMPPSLGGSLQGVPLPSPQFMSNLSPSELQAFGNFWPTVMGIPTNDVLQAAFRPYQGLRGATPLQSIGWGF